MRKVVAYELLSVDGVAEKPERFFATPSTDNSSYATTLRTFNTSD